ncbi:hypothetical protein B0H14DRAFT_2602894 [Mycena olivaceomarginata]|nr:hypothetical protein B0H14DRAFT_2602894 [Mycena olivaceomarginata]
MAQYPLVKTFLVAAWLECVHQLRRRSQRSIYGHPQSRMAYPPPRIANLYSEQDFQVIFGTSVIMFIVATLHIAMNGYRVIAGYVDFGTTPGGPVAFLGVISSWHHIFKDVMCAQSIQDFYTTSFRLQTRYIVAGSCGIEITAAGSTVTVLFANIGPTGSIFDPRLTNWITREKRSAQYRTSRGVFIPILLILVESAGLYLFVETLLLTLYAGITFCMITIRISLRSQKSPSPNEGSQRDLGRTGSVELRHIAVNITKETEDDGNCKKMTPV